MKTMYFEGKVSKIALTLVLSKITKRAFNWKCSPIVYKEFPDPVLPKENWVRVKNIQTGICGSDITFYTCGQSPSMAMYPIPCSDITYLGHETVGIVLEIGKSVKSVQVGDRVILREYMNCCDLKGYQFKDFCDNCKKGEYSICSNYGEPSKINTTVGAGFGDTYIGPESQVLRIEDNINDDEAVLIEPAAVSLHAVMKKIPKAGEKVLVIGAGMIGLNIIQMIKIFSPNAIVYVLDKIKTKQELALKLGADKIVEGNPYDYIATETNAKKYQKGNNVMLIGGMDIIFDTVGKHGMLDHSLRWLRARGTLVKVGYQMTTTKFDETPIWWQELNIIGVDSYGVEEYNGEKIQSFDFVIRLLNEHKLDLSHFITHRFSISEYKKGFRQILNHPNETIKVVLKND